MKISIKYLFIGVVISIVFGFTICLARDVFENIQVDQNAVKIFVNDIEIVSDNFVYNDTTYIPLREINEQLKNTVYWDEEANCARIFGGSNFKTKEMDSNEFKFNNIALLSKSEEVEKILGEPKSKKQDNYKTPLCFGNQCDIWQYAEYILVFYNNELLEVEIGDVEYKTIRDIKIGDDYGMVLHKYGNGYFNEIWHDLGYIENYKDGECTTSALVFDIDNNRRVSKIRFRVTGY